MNEENDGFPRPRRLIEIAPERPLSRLQRFVNFARKLFSRRRKVELVLPPTYMVRTSDFKIVPVEREPTEKNAELKTAAINKQWHPPA